jgi:hypothetical protein
MAASRSPLSRSPGLDDLPDLVNENPGLVRRGRYLSTTFLVEVGATSWLITVREGRIARVERGPFLMRAWSFSIRGSEDAWRRFWARVPEPGYHDLFAMTRIGAARVEGDLYPLMAHLRYVKEVLESPRGRAVAEGAAR